MEKVLHWPTLGTVLMVEHSLKEKGELIKISELKKILPKKIMHQTLMLILDYLQASGKIIIGTKGILWIATPREELKKLREKGLEI